MEPLSGSTRRCESGYELTWEGTLIRVRASSTRSQPRLPGWAASRGDTMAARRFLRQEASPARRYRGLGPQGQGTHSAKVPDQDGL
jgi:hypothetical protein